MFNPGVLMLVIGACSALGIVVVTNYLTFDQTAFAVDTCDSSFNCTNTQTGIDNTQTNDCTDFSSCGNIALSDTNTQSNRCDSAIGASLFGAGCSNALMLLWVMIIHKPMIVQIHLLVRMKQMAMEIFKTTIALQLDSQDKNFQGVQIVQQAILIHRPISVKKQETLDVRTPQMETGINRVIIVN